MIYVRIVCLGSLDVHPKLEQKILFLAMLILAEHLKQDALTFLCIFITETVLY